MLYCQSAPDDHRAAAVFALTFGRSCGHRYPTRTLACLQHGAQARTEPTATEATRCARCGAISPLTLVRVEDVFEERIDLSILRSTLELSVHSPITFAYDRACRTAQDRGLRPVTTYRVPVRWRSASAAGAGAADILQASVTLAVTVPGRTATKAG